MKSYIFYTNIGFIPLEFPSNNKARLHAEHNNRIFKEKEKIEFMINKVEDAQGKTIYKLKK